ncbi:MAG TPA: acetate--CoA ligase family protein, partial [Thermomicrobiaceae bacterium]|nr:acetate--CoA ligase family protein [Thermomicrobiaceae bacterium]
AITTGKRRGPGSVGLVAQSGNMVLTSMASSRGLALAHAVSVGNQAVVDAVDVMRFYLAEPRIRVIAAVIESLSDIAKFRQVAAQAAEQDVAMVVLKLGRSDKASRAAIAHTGSLTGSDQLYDALFKQYGVIRVDDLEELLETAKLLSADRRPAGCRLAVFASSGGECGLMADLAAASRVELPDLAPDCREKLLDLLPPFANPLNPLDITASGWGSRDIYGGVARLLAESSDIDIVACVGDSTRNSGQLASTGWDKMIDGLVDAAEETDKPIAVINTLADVSYEMVDALAGRGIIHLSGARTAMRAIGHAGSFAARRRGHPKLPVVTAIDDDRRSEALSRLPSVGSGGVDESTSKAILRLYGIPVPDGNRATSLDGALRIAHEIGYPVALKIEAESIHHKTEVGGVELGIASDDQLRHAFSDLSERVKAIARDSRIHGILVERMASGNVELIVGGRNDPAFGPIVIAGLGGVMAEALEDASTRLAPVDTVEAEAMLNELRGKKVLSSFRGRPAIDRAAFIDVIVRVSQMLAELPEIQELDLNPVIAGAVSERVTAVDALIVV